MNGLNKLLAGIAASSLVFGIGCAPEPEPPHTIGGYVTGLTGQVELIEVNSGITEMVTANAPYSFTDELSKYDAYDVQVLTQPADRICTVENPTGVVGTSDVTNINVHCNCITTICIGDTGPAGGIVFYVDGTGGSGLEAAPEHQDDGTGAEWGCYGTYVPGADGTAIGTGALNTAQIVAACGAGTAAGLADNYTLNGYDDWFLPSFDELNALYAARGIVGGYARYYYWSSSEYNANNAWSQDFRIGVPYDFNKDDAFRVRAIRAF